MNSFVSKNQDYRLVAFYPKYENVHALLSEIHLYVFGRDGALIDSQAIRRDKAVVALTDDELRHAKLVISPPLESELTAPPTLDAARRQPIFEIDRRFDSGESSYELPAVPEIIWRWWLVHSLWKNVCGTSRKNGNPLG